VSEYKHKRHNVSVLLYHLVCPAKYRRVVFTDEVDRINAGVKVLENSDFKLLVAM